MTKSKKLKNSPVKKEIDKIFQDDSKLLEEFNESLSKKVSKEELSKHGGPLSKIAGAIGSYAGEYNPDDISIDTYNKLRMNAQVAAGLKVIKLPIIGQQWTTICDDKDIAEFIDQLLRPLWYNLLTSILTGIDYGFSAHEIVYDVQDLNLSRKYEQKPFFNKRAIVWKKFKSLYPDTVKIKLDTMENFDGIVQKWIGKDITIPVEKSFIFTHDKGDSFGNLFGVSRLKPAYDVWYWWISLVQFMMRYFERKGTPPVVVKFPLGQTKDGTDHADIALEMGKALIGESVLAIPSTTYENTPPKWDINYLLDDKRGEMFLSALTFFENKILRGMFVPERTITQDSSSKAGSYSLSQTHADMFLLGEEALLVDIENQVNRYVVRRLVEYNFGSKAPQCYIKIERITDARKGFLKDVFMQMVKTGTAIPAAREIADVVGVPLDDDGNPDGIDKVDNKNSNKNNKIESKVKVNSKDKVADKKDNVNNKSDVAKKYSDVNLTESDDMFLKIENYMLSLEKDHYSNLLDISIKQMEKVIHKLEDMLKDKISLEEIFYNKVETDNGQENIVLWQPLRSQLVNSLSALMKDALLYGKQTALEEIKSTDDARFDKDSLIFVKNRSRSLTDKYFANMKYAVEMVVLNASSESKTDINIIDDVKQVFETIKDRDLKNIVETEGMTLLNKGRSFVAKENI